MDGERSEKNNSRARHDGDIGLCGPGLCRRVRLWNQSGAFPGGGRRWFGWTIGRWRQTQTQAAPQVDPPQQDNDALLKDVPILVGSPTVIASPQGDEAIQGF
jgi:hypothetical protein